MSGTVIFKMTGSGNDFVFVDGRSQPLDRWGPERIREVCGRGTGVGADGLVILEPGSCAGRVRFHFFNNDGGRTDMCGNAALCAARMAQWLELASPDCMILETDAGPLEARCIPDDPAMAEIVLPEPTPVSVPDIELGEEERSIHLTTVGVPHLVLLVNDLARLPLLRRGRDLRSHRAIAPGGANVNFVAQNDAGWAMRTYERGVEGETLACGTGAVAAAAALALTHTDLLPWVVRTASGHVLTVSAELADGGQLINPRLLGEGRLVYRGILEG